MTKKTHLQEPYLQNLKAKLTETIPSYLNAAEALSEILSISKEGAYRRLRGESSITLKEALTLRSKLGISLDFLLDSKKPIEVNFQPLYRDEASIKIYLEGILKKLESLAQNQEATIHQVCGSLPYFSQFGYENLAKFKLLLWKGTVSELHGNHRALVSQEVEEGLLNTVSKIHHIYNRIKSTQIWSASTLVETLNQLEYAQECGILQDPVLISEAYKDLRSLVEDTFQWAQHGNKNTRDSFKLYASDMKLSNNTALITGYGNPLLAIGFNGFNTIQIHDLTMVNEFRNWRSSVLSKSIKLSRTGQRERVKFHKRCLDQIETSWKRLHPENELSQGKQKDGLYLFG